MFSCERQILHRTTWFVAALVDRINAHYPLFLGLSLSVISPHKHYGGDLFKKGVGTGIERKW